MKKIRLLGVLALAVICLTVMSGCGRSGNDSETDGSEMQSGSDHAGDNTAATDRTDESRDHGNDNTQKETDEEGGTGGLLDDIGDGITDAMDDIGDAAGDIMDDIGGSGSMEDDTDRGSVGNGENRMR